MNNEVNNVISVDVENWNCRPIVRRFGQADSKDEFDMEGVVEGVRETLSIFRKYNRVGTFFVLGIVATIAPETVELIEREGHEVAIHGFHHRRLREFDRQEFERQIRWAVSIVRKIVGYSPKGFRAPNFSMTSTTGWVLDILQQEGFDYDSSIMPSLNVSNIGLGSGVATSPHRLYKPSHTNPLRQTENSRDTIVEFPTVARRFLRLNVPAGGGFYLRLLGANYMLRAVRSLNKRGVPAMLYLHNWEVNPGPTHKLARGAGFVANFGIPVTKHLSHLLRNLKTAKAIDVVSSTIC